MTQQQWIYSPVKDLLFVSGCVILSPLCFLAFTTFSRTHSTWGFEEATVIAVIWFIFESFFDNPHIFRTFARTHADSVEFKRHRFLHTYGLAGLILLGFSSHWFDFYGELYFVISVIGSWHIFKQNIGFLKLYNSKNKSASLLRKTDSLFFYTLYFYYLSGYLFIDTVPVLTDLKKPFESYFIGFESVCLGALVISFILMLAQNFKEAVKNQTFYFAKWALILALGVNYLFMRNILLICPLIMIIVIETIYHDVQYQMWMNYYQEKRFGVSMGFLNKWFLMSIGYGLVFALFNLVMDNMVYISTLGFMIILYHYIADGFIWKFSRQEDLRPLLK